jgi:hypothetical protein
MWISLSSGEFSMPGTAGRQAKCEKFSEKGCRCSFVCLGCGNQVRLCQADIDDGF